MRGLLSFLFATFVLSFASAETDVIEATYSVPLYKIEFNKLENPNYSTTTELEKNVCELDAPQFIRYFIPRALVGTSLPVLLKRSHEENGYHYYSGRNVNEAMCTFSKVGEENVGLCLILYENLKIDANRAIEVAQEEFPDENPLSFIKRKKASLLFASSEPRGFLQFQYNCVTSQ